MAVAFLIAKGLLDSLPRLRRHASAAFGELKVLNSQFLIILAMKKIVLMAVMAVMAVTAMAQTNVVRAYEALKQSSCASIERSNTSQSQGRCNGQLEICRFETTNTSSKRLVENLLDAFETDREDAYSYVNHQAGDERERYSIYYDPNNSEVVGNDKSMNYKLLSVTDPDDDNGLMRYCYVVEWQEDDDGQLSGREIGRAHV